MLSSTTKGEGVKLHKPRIIYKLMYWSTRKKGDQEEPFGQQDYDMTDLPPGNPMDNTEMSKVYQRLYDDPTIYKLEIWQFFAGFSRDVPGRPKERRDRIEQGQESGRGKTQSDL